MGFDTWPELFMIPASKPVLSKGPGNAGAWAANSFPLVLAIRLDTRFGRKRTQVKPETRDNSTVQCNSEVFEDIRCELNKWLI